MYKTRPALFAYSVAALLHGATAFAGATQTGQSGLVHMPDARIAEDGTWRVGVARMEPYRALWSSISLLPRVEVSGRFTRISDTQPFADTAYGAHKDKAFDAKLLLFAERGPWPALAIGVHDFVGDNRIFRGSYAVASRSVDAGAAGHFDLTAGFGRGRIDGTFGGLRWQPPGAPAWRALVEWDAFDYENDYYATVNPALPRSGGLTYGIEYARGWLAGQASWQQGHWGVNLHLALPLQQHAFVPRRDEPRPVAIFAPPRAKLAEWADAPASLDPLFRALAVEGIGDVRIAVVGDQIKVSVAERRMTMIGRAAGRAARAIALHAPVDARALELTLTDYRLPLVTYRFDDLELLRAYFTGDADGALLQPTLSVSYADAAAYWQLDAHGTGWTEVFGPPRSRVATRAGAAVFGVPLSVHTTGRSPGVFRLQPVRASFTFNDPNGVLKHDLYTSASFTQWLGRRAYLSTAVRYSLSENISDTVGASNSTLPRVRSEVGRYRREGERLRLQALYGAHLANPTDRVYAWFSGGILEEMFAGVGGEALYLPDQGNWALSAAAYAVRQRDFEGRLGFFDYQTVTALVSHHYRIPRAGLTLTTRVGRFLARDHGARFELRRRFRSGFEVGAWYTVTDARDITSPGSPDNPYRDKGVFLRFAVGPFLTRDNAAVVDFALSPWARDPGQMLGAPGGLYELYERRLLLNLDDAGPWSDFGH